MFLRFCYANRLHACTIWVSLIDVKSNAWTRYLRAITTPDNDRTIAEKLGVSPSTISRWVSGEADPKPRQVVALARAYAKNPLPALIAAGYLEEADVEDGVSIETPVDLSELTTHKLLEEVQARVEIMGDLISWVEQLGGGKQSSAGLGVEALKFAAPYSAPVETDGEVFIGAFGDVLDMEDCNGTQIYRPRKGAPVDVVRLDDHRIPADDDLRAVASERSEDRGEDDGYDA